MRVYLLFAANSILLGVGLAMDAFSVSLANGLQDPKMSKKRMTIIAGAFGVFQALMPMIGWVCVQTIVEIFKPFQKVVPWIALILLLYIGGSMIYAGIKHETEEDGTNILTAAVLFTQAVATSIDALSVGFTIASYSFIMAVVCSMIIAVVTFIICMTGLYIGKKFGTRSSDRATIIGGVILILIGVEIFISGVF